jgi:hypothetical protein
MIRDAVLDITDALALGLADRDQCGTYYDDLIRILGQSEILTNGAAQTTTANTRTYETPDEAVDVLAVFAGERHLQATPENALESINKDWRSETGTPRVLTLEDENENSFSLYPTPNTTVTPSAIFATAFGAGFLPGQISILYTEERTDIPDWLALFVAVAVMEREFTRESDHRDIPTSSAATALAAIIKKMVLG